MGILSITTSGSFPDRAHTFSANEHGHAHAVAQAIEWLSSVVLPAAIEQDHQLHDEGARPARGFDAPDPFGRRDVMEFYAINLPGGNADIACADCLEEALREHPDRLGVAATALSAGECCGWCGKEGT